MWKVWMVGALLAAASFGAGDRFGNTNDPQELPCTFADGAKTCSVEFTIVGFKSLSPAGKAFWSLWQYSVVLDPPDRYLAWMEWRIYTFDGKHWVDGGALNYNPYDHSATSIATAAPDKNHLRCRLTVKVLAGDPPPETAPIVVIVTPGQRADFVPLPD